MRFPHIAFCAVYAAALPVSYDALLSPAAAAIYSSQQALPPQVIQEFIGNPSALLTQYPNGGAEMVARVRDLAASDQSVLSVLIGLLSRANTQQAAAIGNALAQVALLAVKADPSYANEIQQAMVKADVSHGGLGDDKSGTPADAGSSQPKIGNAVTTQDQVEGVTDSGTHPISAGNSVYANELVRTGNAGQAELLFLDHTNLTVGPVTEVRLDKFVYDPNNGSGTVVFNAPRGAFRFITGVQDHKDYAVKTPYATMGVRGTVFYVVIGSNSEKVQLGEGQVIVTTISGQVVSLTIPGSILLIDSYGNTQSQTPTNQPIANFADLGPPATHSSFADAFNAFNAVTGDTVIGAVGGFGGGGGGGGGTGGSGGGGGNGGGSDNGGPDFKTFSLTNPDNFTTTTNSISQSVSATSP